MTIWMWVLVLGGLALLAVGVVLVVAARRDDRAVDAARQAYRDNGDGTVSPPLSASSERQWQPERTVDRLARVSPPVRTARTRDGARREKTLAPRPAERAGTGRDGDDAAAGFVGYFADDPGRAGPSGDWGSASAGPPDPGPSSGSSDAGGGGSS